MRNNWNCRIGSMPAAPSLATVVTNAGLTMNDWGDFEDVMMDEEALEKDKENYKCWMQNYLTGCTSCPPCPSDDPYAP